MIEVPAHVLQVVQRGPSVFVWGLNWWDFWGMNEGFGCGEISCGQTGTQKTEVLLQMLVNVYIDFLQAKNFWLDISS